MIETVISTKQPFGIYIHWPYCERKCPYCDFASTAAKPNHDRLVAALLAEYERRIEIFNSQELASIYFGGGTPSLMRVKDVALILNRISQNFDLESCEITMEVNPASTVPDKLRDLHATGINRLSIGVQSFQDDILNFLGRLHDGKMAKSAIEGARKAGFDNLSLDLILATRLSRPDLLSRDLREASLFSPEHMSCYLLTIEDETPFGKRQQDGEQLTLSDEKARTAFELTRDSLRAAGYDHYEISSYARPRFESIHNGLYWDGFAYLGLGPAAHSYRPPWITSPPERRENTVDPGSYMHLIEEKNDPISFSEKLTPADIAHETILTGLRRLKGISESAFQQRTGLPLAEAYESVIRDQELKGWLEWKNDGTEKRLVLTEEGLLFSNDVFLAFFS